MKAGRRYRPYEVEIEVNYMPFPSEEARREAYRTHVKLFLKAKMRQLIQERKNESDAEKNKGAGI